VIPSVMLVKSVRHVVYWMHVARTKFSKLYTCCKDYISFQISDASGKRTCKVSQGGCVFLGSGLG